MCFGTWCSSNRGAYFHINNLSTMQVKFSIVSRVFVGRYQIALLCDPLLEIHFKSCLHVRVDSQ